jgi:hypothetical protein
MSGGDPKDVAGECNAYCLIGDSFGDNEAIMRCQLAKGHEGPHRETFRNGTCVLTWERDERCYHDKGIETDAEGGVFCSKCFRDVERPKDLASE